MAEKKQKKVKTSDNRTRPPIVTLMGHVDHGKTSLLDAIRKSQITLKESGGITQHIGAYNVEKDGKKITFIDTPGHEVFTQMRVRGGQAADIVILVVAADDGVMPQTKEAIMHAKAARVPIIVAISKCDLESANPTRVKKQLSQEEVFVEGYGGNVVAVEVSAVEKAGIEELLDAISLVAEVNSLDLRADPEGVLEALIIESRHDAKRGIIVSAIVKNGTLRVRDEIVAGNVSGRVKLLMDSYGRKVKQAAPGDAVEILGFGGLPVMGDVVRRKNEMGVKVEVVAARGKEGRREKMLSGKKVLNLVVRADTVGTQEAIVSSIENLKVEDAVPNILFAGTGDVKESDVLLASTGQGIILAFKVGVSPVVKDLAGSQKVIIRRYDVIYKMLEDVEGALEGVLEIEEAKIKGRGLVIKLFTLPRSGMIVVGTLVEAGRFKKGNRIGIFREDEDVPLYVSKIRSIHVGQKEAESVGKGAEAGLLFKPQVEDVQLDDRVEVL